MKKAVPVGLLVVLVCGCAGRGLGPSSAADGAEISAKQLYERGVELGRAGDNVRAEQYIGAAIEHGYPVDEAAPELVRVCIAGSQLRAALRHAEPHLFRHPNDSALRYLVAALHFALEQPVEARDELQRLTTLDPAHAQANYLLAVLARDTFAMSADARAHFRRYLELSPDGEHAPEAVAWLVEKPRVETRPIHADDAPVEVSP